MTLVPRGELPFHGGLDYGEIKALGLNPLEVADFSSNLNPFFPSSGLLEGVCAGSFAYPDAGYSGLRAAIAGFHGVGADCVFAGNGASEIIHLLCRCLRGGETVLVASPTFSEYERAAVICGARVVRHTAGVDLRFNPSGIARAVKLHRPALVFVCNPNNPTGLLLPDGGVEEIVRAAGETVVVIDESYADFTVRRCDSTPLTAGGNATGGSATGGSGVRGGSVVVIRSLTKFFGLAGVRMGYAVSSPQVTDALNRVRPPWNVNSVACRAAEKVFSLPENVRTESRRRLFAARDRLAGRLRAAGKECLPTDTGFFLVRQPDARKTRDQLLKKGVAVRDCSSFGLPSHIRVRAMPERECDKLLEAWKEADDEG